MNVTIYFMNKQRLYKYNLPLCLLPYSGVQHILCFVLLRLVHPMLPVCLDCAFLIALSVFSNVYWSLSTTFKRPVTSWRSVLLVEKIGVLGEKTPTWRKWLKIKSHMEYNWHIIYQRGIWLVNMIDWLLFTVNRPKRKPNQ
jgi:hypothetical protein